MDNEKLIMELRDLIKVWDGYAGQLPKKQRRIVKDITKDIKDILDHA